MLDNIRKMLGIYYHPEYRRMTKIIDRMDDEETKLYNQRWNLIKNRKCLLDNKDEIEAIGDVINKHFSSFNSIVEERRSFVVALLNGFPSGIVCTIEHISESVRIPCECVSYVLTRHYVLTGHWSHDIRDGERLLSNWRRTTEFNTDYYERVEMEEYKDE